MLRTSLTCDYEECSSEFFWCSEQDVGGLENFESKMYYFVVQIVRTR